MKGKAARGALEDAYRYCAGVTRSRARNFYLAFLTLPPSRRRALYAIYAFCRRCDDIADGGGPASGRRQALGQVRQDLAATLRPGAPAPADPVYLALADAVAAFSIPARYFTELLAGLASDLSPRSFATFAELRRYCFQVASTVGLMCLQVFGYTDPRARRAAVQLGIGMQLTNILRDLAEDAGRGRVYLPAEELARFGYSEGRLRAGVVDDAFRALMGYQVVRARRYFRRGQRLLPLLPRLSRPCPAVLHGVYGHILTIIEGLDYDVFRQRVQPRSWKKLRLALGLWARYLLLPAPNR